MPLMEFRWMRWALAFLVPAAARAGDGLDTPVGAIEAVSLLGLDRQPPEPRAVDWLRIRWLAEQPVLPAMGEVDPDRAAQIARVRASLAGLRRAGYLTACAVGFGAAPCDPVRPGGGRGSRAPLDLRLSFERAAALGRTYGDLVDAWEIDNEPDIPFFTDNADVFTAYYKAVALGLASVRRGGLVSLARAVSPVGFHHPKAGGASNMAISLRAAFGSSSPTPRIVMPAMCLPPGPYFTQLLENGLLDYTEGGNYHYYGFAMDHAGVYAQFADAVAPISSSGADHALRAVVRGPRHRSATSGGRPPSRKLPVFATEWGYSLLDGHDAQTVAGRVRQWRFFRAVDADMRRLGVDAPMAFVLRPFYEYGMKEFGLRMPAVENRSAHFGFVLDAEIADNPDTAGGADGVAEAFRAGGLVFDARDFDPSGVVEPWMRRIGERVGEAEASPALAWLLDRAGEGRSLPWSVRTDPPSPVVIDFIADADAPAVKSYQGHWLTGAVEEGGDLFARRRIGHGKLVLYNFSNQPAEVLLRWPEELTPRATINGGAPTTELVLGVGERKEIEVRARARADAFLPSPVRLAAEVRGVGGRTISRWSTRFYADPRDYVARDRRDFTFAAEAAETNRARLLARTHAPEEPPLRRDGRWLVTDGLRVEETVWGWRLHVDHFPGVGLRPAVAELPLPSGWRLPEGTVLSYDHRLVSPPGARALSPGDSDARFRLQTGASGAMAESYLRTANGNLFSTVPRLAPKEDWKRYNQSAETFTMLFLGRAAPPWRFADNEPVALVFFVRPARLPAVLEVRDPHLASFGLAGSGHVHP